MDQVPLPIMIGLDYTWDKKVAMYLCVFPSQMLVLKKKSASKLCFGQHVVQLQISVIIGGTRNSITDIEKNPTNIICSCSEK